MRDNRQTRLKTLSPFFDYYGESHIERTPHSQSAHSEKHTHACARACAHALKDEREREGKGERNCEKQQSKQNSADSEHGRRVLSVDRPPGNQQKKKESGER